MNCLPSAVGLTKSLTTMSRPSSIVMQWLTSGNSTSPVWSPVQPWRNVSSKPRLANAEVSASRIFSFDDFDVAILIMSSINLGQSAASRSTPAIGCRMYCNVQQCLPMRPSGCHRFQNHFLGYIIGLRIGWQHCSGKFRSAWQWFFAHWCWRFRSTDESSRQSNYEKSKRQLIDYIYYFDTWSSFCYSVIYSGFWDFLFIYCFVMSFWHI